MKTIFSIFLFCLFASLGFTQTIILERVLTHPNERLSVYKTDDVELDLMSKQRSSMLEFMKTLSFLEANGYQLVTAMEYERGNGMILERVLQYIFKKSDEANESKDREK